MDTVKKVKIKVTKPYIEIRPGRGKKLVKGIIIVDIEKAERLIKSGRASEIISKKQRKLVADKKLTKKKTVNSKTEKERAVSVPKKKAEKGNVNIKK